MANKDLFNNKERQHGLVKNNAGGVAYQKGNEEALANFVMTGCFNNTFYTTAENQLETALKLLDGVDPKFVAKLAVYGREKGHMKDTPVLLVAWLMGQDNQLFKKAFEGVIGLEKPIRGSGKLLRNFVQMVRSGVTGKRSLTRTAMKCVNTWLNNASDELLFQTYVGNSPTLRDVLRISHPKPKDEVRENLFGWIVNEGGQYDFDKLPDVFKNYLKFKMGSSFDFKGIPFRMLTSRKLDTKEWTEIGLNMSWHELRQNLNTLHRHDVFKDAEVTSKLRGKLLEQTTNDRIKVMPYQMLSAYAAVRHVDVPFSIKAVLNTLLENSLKNVPVIPGKTLIAVDTSGSMTSPVTGYQRGKSSSVQCREVAALFAASLYKVNPENTVIYHFDTEIERCNIDVFDSLNTITNNIFNFFGGGTDVSLAGKVLHDITNTTGEVIDNLIIISDNESWFGEVSKFQLRTKTVCQEKIDSYMANVNPNLKVTAIDITPGKSTQTKTSKNVLNVGGFSDHVYELIKLHHSNDDSFNWVGYINSVDLGIDFD